METEAETGARRLNPRFLIGIAIFLILAGIVLLFALVNPTSSSAGLLPILATPTAAQNDGDSLAPIPVTFTELNSDPLAYLNLPIQVSGGYLKLDPQTCPRYSGPQMEWALVADNLQLDAKGFERVVRILPPGTDMTVQGIWRLYQGPLGCGKGPESGSVWYLQVQRVVQPNPLVGDGSGNPIDIESVDPGLPDLLPTDIPTATPSATPTMVTVTPSATATQGAFAPTITVAATSTIDAGLATPLATATPVTFTPAPGTPDPSATPSATATPQPGGGNPEATATPLGPLPPTATQTSGGGYPGPPTATPTASPDPYP